MTPIQDTRYENISAMVLGEIVLMLVQRANDCKRNIERAPNEALEEFYRESLVEYMRFKHQIVDMYLNAAID